VLEGRQGRNTIVKPVDSWNQLDPEILIALIKSRKQAGLAQEIIQVRRMLEVEAAGLAAVAAVDADLKALRHLLVGMTEASPGAPDYLSLENQFHARVWRSSGNRLLWQMLNNLREVFESAKQLVMIDDDPGRDLDHAALVKALEAHDVGAARAAMERDVIRFQEQLRSVLENGLHEPVDAPSIRLASPLRNNTAAQLPGAICLWSFGWYTYVSPGEPYADLGEAMRQTRERGFDTIRICAMPGYVTRAIESGRDELEIASLGKGIVDNLRWYNFQGGVKIKPASRLLHLCEEARRHGVRIIASSWDFNQSFRFEVEPHLRDALQGMITVSEQFAYIEHTWHVVLHLLADHNLLDVISVVELHNELEGMEIGPSSQLFREMSANEAGPKGTAPGSVRRIRSRTRDPIERTIAGLRAEFPQLLYTVNTVWPWTDPQPPANQDVYSVNFYVTDSMVLADYLALFEDGDLWQGRILDERVRPLLREGAPPFDEWMDQIGGHWQDPYYAQSYLGLWADPRRMADFFSRVFSQGEPIIKRQVITWLDNIANASRATGKSWYLGEGYADLASVTSLWDEGDQCRQFHAWVVEQAIARGATGLTPNAVASPENPDVWSLVDWLKGLNERIAARQ
jgi:DNA-binding FadR family transcriptional regulator